MDRPDWAPEEIDIDRPSQARMYDYLLGGSHNFEADRDAAKQGLAVMPDLAVVAQTNRAFLYRAVRFLLDAGIRQFLDIGSGVPTVGNVHEVAQRANPQARVVYVDIDPVAVAHSRALLASNRYTTVIQEDLRRPGTILQHPQVRELLDFDQPVGLLLVAILHTIPDQDEPNQIIARLRDALAPGSHLVIGHPTADSLPEVWETFVQMSIQAGNPITPRSHAEVTQQFAGFELVAPGLVWAPSWRPDDPAGVGDHPERTSNYAGVGRKP